MILSDKAFFTWLLSASLSMLLLWVVYSCFFRTWTFFALNRWILIAGTCACLALPLISSDVVGPLFTSEDYSQSLVFNLYPFPDDAPPETGVNAVAVNSQQPFEWIRLTVALVYWAGVAFMLVRSLKTFAQLRGIKNEAELITRDISNVWAQSRLPTFSFGRDIFLHVHTLSLSAEQLATVRRHEEAHVLQKHSVDNIFFEIVTIIFWFNPFAGKLSRYLRDVHEFLADQWALAGRREVTDYQQLLVSLASGASTNRLAQPFSNSQFFRRIVMLNKPRTNYMERFKLLLLVPTVAAAMFLTACVDEDQNAHTDQQAVSTPPASAPVISKITWVGNHAHSDSELNKLLGIKTGDLYDHRVFEDAMNRGTRAESVTNLYMNNGYLFFRTEISEKHVGNTVELTVNVQEGERAWVNNVTLTVKNGAKLQLDQLRPLLDVKKGQLFNRALLVTSQEKLAKSGLVRSDSVEIHPIPLAMGTPVGKRLIDFEFVVQKP
ncbi:POTRA domain-containing protein [Dyadobacter sp. CY323]|uniref:M56 family metallopeptidase n=1 Tax=Dyadobacter sp. CY323 TaxID=2907302 RepID=UPI001F2BCD6E|nr:M56 family metallopeptidase [Dyadobacter sp. CY323]MCE6988082.1 hypothetical protein [Dyadobacter sp. CY323]